MAWFKVDDGFYSHHKVILIPRSVRAEAIGTWTLCGTWSADKLKDGYVPSLMVEELGGTLAGAEALVAVKLWRPKTGGFQFINWSEFQPTRKKVEETRARERDRKSQYRSKAHDSAVADGNVPVGHNRFPTTPTRPDPTPSSTKKEAANRGSRVPKNFVITDDLREWAKVEAPLVNLDKKLGDWIDYWAAVPGAKGIKSDWVATWRNGMRKQQQFAESDRKPDAGKKPMTVAELEAKRRAASGE